MTTSKVNVTLESTAGLTKKQVVDVVVEQELDEFSKWLTSTFNGTEQMASFERALVKTYIMHKLEDQVAQLGR